MIVYLSGPMTGHYKLNKPAFLNADIALTSLGHTVLDPALNPEGLTRDQHMHLDFAMIDVADAIVMLPGWTESLGARDEWHYAVGQGKSTWDLDELLAKGAVKPCAETS